MIGLCIFRTVFDGFFEPVALLTQVNVILFNFLRVATVIDVACADMRRKR